MVLGEDNRRKDIGLDFVSKITACLFAGGKDRGGLRNGQQCLGGALGGALGGPGLPRRDGRQVPQVGALG